MPKKEPLPLIDGGDHWIVQTATGPLAIIDKEDGELVEKYRWRVVTAGATYPVVSFCGEQWAMAQVLVGERTKIVYADGNGLNNRRDNILTPKKIKPAEGGVMEIPLTQGMVALIDEEDYPLVAGRYWFANKCSGIYYARTMVEGVPKDMAKLILPAYRRISYLNGNRLDNRRGNLDPGIKPNIVVKDGIARIPLTKGLYALIDEEDLPLVMGADGDDQWCAVKGARTWYARRFKRVKGKNTGQKMHRLIMGEPEGLSVDHINGEGLDNRKSNLRAIPQQANAWNRRNGDLPLSGFPHVYICGNRFRVIIRKDYKSHHFGYFYALEEAVERAISASKELFGEFSPL